MSFLDESAIVACHPDDELLWFGSVLGDVDRVIVAYEDAWFDPALGNARRAALAAYPRQIESLGMGESGSAGCANWKKPRVSRYGLKFGAHVAAMDAKHITLHAAGAGRTPHLTRRAHYVANYHALRERLRVELEGIANVFTHNPWGEYGHEDHVQMYRVVADLREDMGFAMWMSNYVTERSMGLATTYFGNDVGEVVQRPVDTALCDLAVAAYRNAGCWTWADEWSWFETETFCRTPGAQTASNTQNALMRLNAFNIDPVSLA